jgi:endonuclease YncB( thermonuclease family)
MRIGQKGVFRVSSTKSRTRRKPAKKQSGQSLWPLLGVCALVVGGIQVYEHRDNLLPSSTRTTKASQTGAAPKKDVSSFKTAAIPPKPVRPESPVTKVQKQAANEVPVPPRAVPMPVALNATVPASRPAEVKSEDSKDIQKAAKASFAFCGMSGLNNCVASGDTFWLKGTKVRIAGIVVPQTDNARCLNERQRGFAAKVRLRDMLNHGAFDVAPGAADGKVISRSGASFGEQLIREGLARPANAKNQSWC